MITRQRVPSHRRIHHTAGIFVIHFPMALEPAIYSFTRRLSSEYCGGYWHFYELSNGGFYMAPDDDTLYSVSCENGFEISMTGEALGITACLYAYSRLSFSVDAEVSGLCARHYHLLRDFMMDHGEVGAILGAID